MSVLVSDRTESKFEAITYSIELHDMLIDFMQHGFGVKSVGLCKTSLCIRKR